MIGWYVHHQGSGHLHRALAVAHQLQHEVVGVSSLSRPDGWPGDWIDLPLDVDDSTRDHSVDPTARGRLHWVPEHGSGLRERTAAISRWIAEARPDLVVVDVSVEVALACRLHGIPVITMVLPGQRTDPAHQLVHAIARRVIAPWPGGVDALDMGRPAPSHLTQVGAVSRFDGRLSEWPADGVEGGSLDGDPRVAGGARRAVLMIGRGGSSVTAVQIERLRAASPGWEWTVLGGPGAEWTRDPWPVLCDSNVVVSHAGLNALAEIAAARVPAVVFAEDRPHDEQRHTVRALQADHALPVVAVDALPIDSIVPVLERAAALPGRAWSGWSDGRGAHRLAAVIDSEVRR